MIRLLRFIVSDLPHIYNMGRSVKLFAAGILLAAQTTVAQITTSFRGNLSSTLSRPSVSQSGQHCCNVLPESVGLNFWHDTTYTVYPTTVITQYLQYNNTVLTSLSTRTTGLRPSSAPQDIISAPTGTMFTYSGSRYHTEDFTVYPGDVTMASPTPYVHVTMFQYLSGILTTLDGTETCSFSGTSLNSDHLYLPTPYIYLDGKTYKSPQWLPPAPSAFVQQVASQYPLYTSVFTDLLNCTIISGTGEPTVHIPVTALTSYESTTIRMTGAPPPAESTPRPEPSPPPAPASSLVPPPASTRPPQSPAQPDPTSVPQPSATQTNPAPVPQPSNLGPSPPINTPNPPIDTLEPPTGASPSPPPIPGASNSPPPQDDDQPPRDDETNPPSPSLPIPIVPVPIPDTTRTQDTGVTNVPTPGGVVLPGDQTLNPGEVTTLPGGNIISVPIIVIVDDATPSPLPVPPVVVVDGTTVTLPSGPASTLPVPIIPASVQTGLPSPGPGAVVIPGGQTLNPGQVATVSGIVISIPSDAPQSTVVNGITIAPPPVVVLDGTTIIIPTSASVPSLPVNIVPVPQASGWGPASPGAVILPNSETLNPGQVTTISGTVISAPTPQVFTSGGVTRTAPPVIVIDGSTMTIPASRSLLPSLGLSSTSTTSSSQSLSRIEGAPATSRLPTSSPFTGAASRSASGRSGCWLALLTALSLLLEL
ncbi:hypothetical protein FB567DRAFT_5407 [Paraphoma chrysanthemicola]|uniref:Uncharacterized protein n=1 Tax=Paraphoma chrysanthemicola TaxID=798071 RepID=A0A8K0RJH7_9PLEO|nr:hypothetical protein FB567DRAFT_5407 [Paraphoma chrysanthemicola]